VKEDENGNACYKGEDGSTGKGLPHGSAFADPGCFSIGVFHGTCTCRETVLVRAPGAAPRAGSQAGRAFFRCCQRRKAPFQAPFC